QGASRVHYILNKQYVPILQPRFRIVDQLHRSTGDGGVTVAGSYEEVYLKRPVNGAHKVTEKYEAPLEEAEHEQIAVRIGGRNFRAEFAHATRYRLLIEDDAFQGVAAQPRVCANGCVHRRMPLPALRAARLPRYCGKLLESTQ